MLAPAKINLDLLITGRRNDGFHLLDSLVVFADYGDEITAEPSDSLSLDISGPFADSLENNQNNLILKAAKLICDYQGIAPNIRFHLIKNLPVSSGIGGGSADAAAALKICMKMFSIDIGQQKLQEIALKLGADVPVCLQSMACQMTGIGDSIKILNIKKPLHILLVNAGVSVSTPDVFKKYAVMNCGLDKQRHFKEDEIHFPFMLETLIKSKNSLEEAACNIKPVIKKQLRALLAEEGILIARMSGSGATCYGLFDNNEKCKKAAINISKNNQHWWVRAVVA